MPITKATSIADLKLNLKNYRTVPQEDDIHAIHAMIAISPDRFWALMESLLDDGYLPTENILVLEDTDQKTLEVKEGNRRVAALKMIHKQISVTDIQIPDNIQQKIDAITAEWLSNNDSVPCAIYQQSEAATVDRIVTLTHGKGEKAGRDNWTAVARARHNRDENNATEPALDLLEKYLSVGKNITFQQKERWAGLYPITVLDEAIKKLASSFGYGSAPELAKNYPTVSHRSQLENILFEIGLGTITFTIIRDKDEDFAVKYGPQPKSSENTDNPTQQNSGNTGPETSNQETSQDNSKKKKAATALTDPKTVTHALKSMVIQGTNREKVVTLKKELLSLTLAKNPVAFCFLLRSMFEISAKAYCIDHGLSSTKPDGNDKRLAELLKEITAHITNNNKDKPKTKLLHGAITELGKPEGILSVTSMNQLVHNPSFSVLPSDIAILFMNVFPLLQEINK